MLNTKEAFSYCSTIHFTFLSIVIKQLRRQTVKIMKSMGKHLHSVKTTLTKAKLLPRVQGAVMLVLLLAGTVRN
jgi:hypothetical protein